MTARRSKASWGRSDGDGDFGSRSSEDLEAATRLGPSWAVKSRRLLAPVVATRSRKLLPFHNVLVSE